MNNIPVVKVGIVAVSRDCFPESLSVNRRRALVEAYKKRYQNQQYKCANWILTLPVRVSRERDSYASGAGGY